MGAKMKKIKLLLMCAVVATPSLFAIGADASINVEEDTKFQRSFGTSDEVTARLELPELG
jgi:hypothetical protein